MKKMEFESDNKIHAEDKESTKWAKKQTKFDELIDKSNQMSLMLYRIENIEKILKNIWSETIDKREEEIKELKWKYAGIVLDRLFFYLSILYFLFTFFPLIFTVANFYRPQ